ncbi:UNVERIFIED_CONTAM: hypothetical protein GTU68_015146 [Idotea baltica]|nr:hypothetical protein [Idotea baltica]
MKELTKYREPDHKRSAFELVVTVVPFAALCVAAWWSLSIGYWLTLLISIPAAGFLVRLFLIQHDCGHYAFFRSRAMNDWVGRTLGVVTLTPYYVWRRSHAIHHATSGNLDKRGIGDIDTLTVREYQNRSAWGKFLYQLYRHPVVMFVIGPAYQFLIRNRLPQGVGESKTRYWVSSMGTNLSIALVAGLFIYAIGAGPFFMVFLPISMLAASIGVWLFYVQHQFEDTIWEEVPEWEFHDAALYGSSHYDLPPVLRWITANIGVHHIHHLYNRIPYYRLPDVLADFPELTAIRRLTLADSISCVKLRLWDEDRNRLISFPEAKALYPS